jgi:hypothetical protein
MLRGGRGDCREESQSSRDLTAHLEPIVGVNGDQPEAAADRRDADREEYLQRTGEGSSERLTARRLTAA